MHRSSSSTDSEISKAGALWRRKWLEDSWDRILVSFPLTFKLTSSRSTRGSWTATKITDKAGHFSALCITMTTNGSSFPSNQSTGHPNTAAKTQDLQLCPPFPNVKFETLDYPLPFFVNAALNVPLAIATSVANLAVLFAVRHVTSIRLPSKLLLCSLVLTDLGAGSVVQPQFTAYLFLWATHPDLMQCALYWSLLFTGSTFTTASLLTLAAITLDRYAALFYHLKYQQIVTTRRVCAVLVFIWAVALLLALASLLNRTFWYPGAASAISVTLVVISVACVKIRRCLRARQLQPQAPEQAQQQAGDTLNMARYRKTASAMMWICVLVLICYLPLICVATFRSLTETTTLSECLWTFSYLLVLLNSFVNPFVYCLRLPDIRTEVVKQLRKLFCLSASRSNIIDRELRT